jgi:hypothetical protein
MGFQPDSKWAMRRRFEKAAKRGHVCGDLVPERVTRTQYNWAAVCSCGWKSNPKKRKLNALSLAYAHVLEVLDRKVPPSTSSGTRTQREEFGVSEPDSVGGSD